MKDQIEVTVMNNDVTRKYRFTIQIPYSLVENTNFLEVMETYKISNPVGWLEALANFIRSMSEEQNG